jgi:hypothetical protein
LKQTFVQLKPVRLEISSYEYPSAFSIRHCISLGFSAPSASAVRCTRSRPVAASSGPRSEAGTASAPATSASTDTERSRCLRRASASCLMTVCSHGRSSSRRVVGAFVSRISRLRW